MIREIAKNFNIPGKLLAHRPFGCGHINETFVLTYKDKNKTRKFVLQKLNNNVFKNIDVLMTNFANVTEFLHKKYKDIGEDPYKRTLTIIKTIDDKNYYTSPTGEMWRVTYLIEDTETFEIADDNEIFGKTGKAFGEFICMLDDYPANELKEVIPDFHNTVKRYENFENALNENIVNRANQVEKEINFAKNHKDLSSKIVDALANGEIPLRVTHNDTKINNILMDVHTGDPVCVIDLDTIMPGSLLYDFGDAIRSGCNTSYEDDKNLDNVDFDIEKFASFTKGFLSGMGDKITMEEKQMLPISAVILTYECGLRFLTDFLQGDVYFKTQYSEHNLVRCRTQFKLVDCMLKKMNEMENIVKKCIL